MKKELRVVQIGFGQRGIPMLDLMLKTMEDIRVVGVCDTYPDRTAAAADRIEKARGYRPVPSEDDRRLLELDADAVLITSAWEGHIDMACRAMEAGFDVGCEVGGAYHVEDCWRLVETARRTGKRCMLLENCCYGRRELMVKNMVEQGLFGEIVHCDGGYCHDLREEVSTGEENRHYRLRNYLARNCENYPTHEIGPISKVLKINSGNRFTGLVSVASKAAGLHEYVLAHRGPEDKLTKAQFAQGDVVTTILKTALGQTVRITLDTTLPRAYSRQFTVRGTKAAYFEDMDAIFQDGVHNRYEFDARALWGNAKEYEKDYDHPLWREYHAVGGHGGIDYLVLRAFFESIEQNQPAPIDVCDMATYMSITALSERSIAQGGAPVEMPDFTSGRWKDAKPKTGFAYEL